MKWYRHKQGVIVILFSFSLLGGACQSRPPHYREAKKVDAVINAEVPLEDQLSSLQKAWLLGLSAPLVRLNGGETGALLPFPGNRKNRMEWQAILKRSWGVVSRESFYQERDRLLQRGDSENYLELLEVVQEEGFDYYQAAAAGGFSAQELKRLSFLSSRQEDLPEGNSLKGWDLARGAVLCRWACLAGYISRDEAWAEMIRLGGALQRRFTSWGELGSNIAMGRGFWTAAYGDGEKAYREVFAVMAQLSAPGKIWAETPWEISLEGVENIE